MRPIFTLMLIITVFLPACKPISKPVSITSPADGATFNGGASVNFSARVNDFEGESLTAKWHFGDDTGIKGLQAEHAYDSKGSYSITVTLTNEFEDTVSDTISINISSSRYRKLNELGRELSDNATDWTMVLDTTTDLIWETKQFHDFEADYDNPRDADNAYTWHDSNPLTNSGDPGIDGDGTDTEDVIAALNNAKFGGLNNWRLPTFDELASIRDPLRFNPSINTLYFPHTSPWYYWSSTTYEEEDFSYAACHVYFMGSPSSAAPAPAARNHYGMKDLMYRVRAVTDAEHLPVQNSD
ncbi:MAG: DUF1566 domain-containing protein [Deltaproteobacteria bacterium]|nr:DUF1566 domain-containing protein [Deltaproteobacteria bacterium]